MPFLLTNISKFCQFHKIFNKNIESSQKLKKKSIEKLKTQEKTQNSRKNPKLKKKNSGSGRHFPPFKRNSRKKLNFTYISLDT